MSLRLKEYKHLIKEVQKEEYDYQKEVEYAKELESFVDNISSSNSPSLCSQWLLVVWNLRNTHLVDWDLINKIFWIFVANINNSNLWDISNLLSTLPYILKTPWWTFSFESFTKKKHFLCKNFPKVLDEVKFRLLALIKHYSEDSEHITPESMEWIRAAIYYWWWDKEEIWRVFFDKFTNTIDNKFRNIEFYTKLREEFYWCKVEEEVEYKWLYLDYKIICNWKVIYVEYDWPDHYSKNRFSTAQTNRKTLLCDRYSSEIKVFRVPHFDVINKIGKIKQSFLYFIKSKDWYFL